MGEYGIRLEDYGKSVMKNLPSLELDVIKEHLKTFLEDRMESKYFMLLSNTLGYYTVFKTESSTIEQRVENMIGYLQTSTYFSYNQISEEDPVYVNMMDIRHIEFNKQLDHLELWIGQEYFQIFDFGWGVEEL